jgi:[acyl-carrier-protein] S-malonyltransferase
MAAREVVLLFPGQGSQRAGMGSDLAAAYPEARQVFDEADGTLGFALSALCASGPDDVLTSTENAQPALLAHGAAAWAVLSGRASPSVRAAAGHSLGEFSAYHAAGAFSLADSLRIVRRRGELMLQSGIEQPGTMAAILGLDAAEVESACRAASLNGDIAVPANFNAPDQTVISGSVGGVERAMEIAKEMGAKRAIRLKVSGAFHSPLMRGASQGLSEALARAQPAAPAFPVFSNVSAAPVSEPGEAVRLLIEQLTSPVRWTDEVRAMAAEYPDALYVELGPGSVLANLVRRIVPDVETAPCGTAADMEQLLARLS